MTHAISAIRRPAEALRTAAPAVLAMLLGAFILYGVGFAGPAVLHNAAHDVRHAFTFPCH
jgi:cobalt transporter subunit CbtB